MKTEDLQQHVNGMKCREDEQRRLSEDHRLKCEVIMRERMWLEDAIYKAEKRDAFYGAQEAPAAVGQ